jgi:hypothetical protein
VTVRVPCALASTALALIAVACRSTPSKMDRMSIETTIHIPWSDALPRSLVPFPEHSESSGREQTPALPLVRLQPRGVAVVNYFGEGFVPGGTVSWLLTAPGAPPAPFHSAADPFGGTRGVLAVDAWVHGDGRLILLEKIAAAGGGEASRLAVLSGTGAPVTYELAGGPYVRIVPDERGHLYLVSHQGGNTLVELDVDTGELGRQIQVPPGSRAALAANRGVVLAGRHLESQDASRLVAPPAMPQALVYLFGVDADDNYYTRIDGEIVAVTFAGQVLGRVPLTGRAELTPAAGGDGIVVRLALSPAWQVDARGDVFVPRVDGHELQVLRIATRR